MINIAIAQSGGPTVAINASLLGIFLEGLNNSEIDKIYGVRNGISGVINDKFVDLKGIIKEKDVDILRLTPAAFLGSCRYKLPPVEESRETYEKIIEAFRKHNIGAFFYIGGNDSMDTVNKLSNYIEKEGYDIKIIGIPKTIDNDLVGTDHTPGFGSAVKFLATTINEIIEDSRVYDVKSITIIGIMGRDAGWLTASACLLKERSPLPILFYLPEVPFELEKFIQDIEEAQKDNNNVIICVSEGIKDINGKYIGSKEKDNIDGFGHENLNGIADYIAFLIKDRIKCKTRAIELNILQRCAAHIASKTDIDESESVGREAIKELIKGKTGIMMSIKRISNDPYEVKIESTSVEKCANEVKQFPIEWINGNSISDEAIKYYLPLINGEVDLKFRDGIPEHLILR